MGLKEYAIEHYKTVTDFVKLVLIEFPNSKLDEQLGEGETARIILKHMVGTPHWWMKRSERSMPFRAAFETIEDISTLLDSQNNAFQEMLNNPDEIHWTPTKSIPWIMIRSANHMMHHASMLIFMRHVWGLPPLGPNNPWGKIVDYPAKIMYEK
ncbi:MAG: hypothetical protein ACW99A_02985 [Candidatus Kariarchaeaceae archaeon]|jgi:hypothetical protein